MEDRKTGLLGFGHSVQEFLSPFRPLTSLCSSHVHPTKFPPPNLHYTNMNKLYSPHGTSCILVALYSNLFGTAKLAVLVSHGEFDPMMSYGYGRRYCMLGH